MKPTLQIETGHHIAGLKGLLSHTHLHDNIILSRHYWVFGIHENIRVPCGFNQSTDLTTKIQIGWESGDA